MKPSPVSLLARYTILAVSGCAVIFVGASVLGVAKAPPVASSLSHAIHASQPARRLRTWSGLERDIDSPVAPPESAAPSSLPAAQDAPPVAPPSATSDAPPITVSVASAPPPQTQLASPPSPSYAGNAHRRSPVGTSGVQWAVATNGTARVYDRNGKFIKKMPWGTQFAVSDIKDTPAGTLAVCELVEHPGTTVLVPVDEIDISSAGVASITETEKRNRVKRAWLIAQLARTEDDIRNKAERRNPYATRYAEAKKAYQTYWRHVNQIKEKMEAGDPDMKYADQLRTMKGEDIALRRQYDAAKKDYEAWARSHPVPIADDPCMVDLRRELEALSASL